VAQQTLSHLPWEQEGAGLAALAHSWVLVCFQPRRAFSLTPAGTWRRHLFFAAACNLALMLGVGLLLAQSGGHMPLPRGLGAAMGHTTTLFFSLGFWFLLNLVVMVYQAGLVNLLLKFITRTPAGFATAFRVACYAQAPQALNLLMPLVGPAVILLVFVWNLVIMTLGVARGYQVSLGRAAAVNIIYAVLTIYLQMVFKQP
jgi:hypothetical protein